jgi:hypothetical protein
MKAATLRKLATGALAVTAMLAVAQTAASSASAAEPARLQSANNLKQISLATFDADGDVDGRDFLIWQRGGSPAAAGGSSDLADWQSNYGSGGY